MYIDDIFGLFRRTSIVNWNPFFLVFFNITIVVLIIVSALIVDDNILGQLLQRFNVGLFRLTLCVK